MNKGQYRDICLLICGAALIRGEPRDKILEAIDPSWLDYDTRLLLEALQPTEDADEAAQSRQQVITWMKNHGSPLGKDQMPLDALLSVVRSHGRKKKADQVVTFSKFKDPEGFAEDLEKLAQEMRE